jgi:hypothetical protein
LLGVVFLAQVPIALKLSGFERAFALPFDFGHFGELVVYVVKAGITREVPREALAQT